jgi:hypothetical protein
MPDGGEVDVAGLDARSHHVEAKQVSVLAGFDVEELPIDAKLGDFHDWMSVRRSKARLTFW